ncbi:MAG: glycoside hydrolase family 99-like domain-containing protein, partial [Victivallaceae bacterium]|nr:glycoside hydrolase family 99-like domain-containing protein [Victivallaceae bacterium]
MTIHNTNHAAPATRKKTQTGCFYFPNYHTGPRHEHIHGANWSEWELVKYATPRFPYHNQPRIPLWGYEDEALPAVMAKKIAAAADYGIDFFIFDWYYYDDGPFLERALEKGFMQAENNNKLKFCCMWANHDWQDIHPAGLHSPKKLLYPGKVSPATFHKICRIAIERYCSHPAYYQIDGCPFFSFYSLEQLISSCGSVTMTRKSLDAFRKAAVNAGFSGLHLNAIVYGNPILPGEKQPADIPLLLKQLGFDSATSYIWMHHVSSDLPTINYSEVAETYLKTWDKYRRELPVPYFPNLTVGWDSSPRTLQSENWNSSAGYPYCSIVTGNTPANFQKALQKIKAKLAKYNQAQIITVNSWNEWTEGSYLEPDRHKGFAYLAALKAEI